MDWDNPLAPSDAPDETIDRGGIRSVTRVSAGGPVEFGNAVQFELAFADGGAEVYRAASRGFSQIVSELRGIAGVTERSKRASPGRPVEVINPYQATDARTDRVGPMIVVRFPTTDGLPLLIAMDRHVAEKLMLGLDEELARSA